ncbi:MAG: hypothetical protein AAFX76_12315 [Planctomycetota bacterium]
MAPLTPADNGDGPLNVLWFGNSYSQFNLLPDRLADLAEVGGHARPNFSTRLVGGATVAGHLQARDGVVAPDDNPNVRWDFTIVQAQSFEGTPVGSDPLVINTHQHLYQFLANHPSGNAANATPIILETWARHPDLYNDGPGNRLVSPERMQADLTETAESAARNMGLFYPGTTGTVARAGTAFFDQGLETAFYNPDGSHPSKIGSAAAAATLYHSLYGRSASELDETAAAAMGIGVDRWRDVLARADAAAPLRFAGTHPSNGAPTDDFNVVLNVNSEASSLPDHGTAVFRTQINVDEGGRIGDDMHIGGHVVQAYPEGSGSELNVRGGVIGDGVRAGPGVRVNISGG